MMWTNLQEPYELITRFHVSPYGWLGREPTGGAQEVTVMEFYEIIVIFA
jgi:hypothetical protein